MATYKVLQDIEAEDKIIGPLTLKQFIFAIVTIAIGFVQFQLITASALGLIRILLVLVFLPPLLVFGFLASPIGRDQPNDIWLLARLRFIIKPHVRIWSQDGINQLVTITAPKVDDRQLTDSLSQQEVTSRLKALANTLDSRGWAVKNIDAQTYRQADFLSITNIDSDRLINPDSILSSSLDIDGNGIVDVLDSNNSQVAQKMDQLVEQSATNHREQVLKSIRQNDINATQPSPTQDYWFLDPSPQQNISQNTGASLPQTLDDSTVGITTSGSQHINPLPQGQMTQTSQANPAILNLAHNDDLNVATIARQAKSIDEQDNEVVVSLR